MGKGQINKALQLNPKGELVLRGKKHLDGLAQAGSKPPASPKAEPNKDEKPSGGGLFGKMFGGKKK